jgi:hypothetical protein
MLELEDALTAVKKVVTEAGTEAVKKELLGCIFVCAFLLALEAKEEVSVDEPRIEIEAEILDGTLADEVLVIVALVSTSEEATISVETTLEDTAAEEEALAAPSMLIQAKEICLVVEEGRQPY